MSRLQPCDIVFIMGAQHSSFGNLPQGMQETPEEVKKAMEEHPDCDFSTSFRTSISAVNGEEAQRKVVQSVMMACPGKPPVTVFENETTDSVPEGIGSS